MRAKETGGLLARMPQADQSSPPYPCDLGGKWMGSFLQETRTKSSRKVDARLGQGAVDFSAQLGFATSVQKARVEGGLRNLTNFTPRETHLTHEYAVLASDVGAKRQWVVGVHRAAHARLAQGAQRVRVVAARHFQQHVAGRAHVQKHAGRREF